MRPVHEEILDGARRIAGQDGTFRLADVVGAVPHLNPATVRTHVASRCCVNAPANHQSRYSYFRALGRGIYRIEPRFRRRARSARTGPGWQDALIAALGSGVDDTLITESLQMSPTERLETMRRAALSLEAMTRR
jgi:hypothetical protein